MKNSIYKYEILIGGGIDDKPVIEMPVGYKILSVQMQHDKPCLWAVVNSEAKEPHEMVRVQFLWLGTGWNIDDHGHLNDYDFVQTLQMSGGGLVFHLLMKKSQELVGKTYDFSKCSVSSEL